MEADIAAVVDAVVGGGCRGVHCASSRHRTGMEGEREVVTHLQKCRFLERSFSTFEVSVAKKSQRSSLVRLLGRHRHRR